MTFREKLDAIYNKIVIGKVDGVERYSLASILKQIRDIDSDITPEITNLFLKCELEDFDMPDQPGVRPPDKPIPEYSGPTQPEEAFIFEKRTQYIGWGINGWDRGFLDRQYGGKNPTILIIPKEHKGESVTTLRYTANPTPVRFRETKINKVIIPKPIDNIESEIFWRCGIKELTLPDTLRVMGQRAFRQNSFTNVRIPPLVRVISHDSFSYGSLIKVDIAGEIEHYVENCFRGNNLESVPSLRGTEAIGFEAFASNSIKELDIPDSVRTIGSDAFSENNITSLTIGRGINTIERRTFEKNELEELVIPGNVKLVGDGSFYDNKLLSLKLSDGVETVSDSFRGNKINKLYIADSVISCYNPFTWSSPGSWDNIDKKLIYANLVRGDREDENNYYIRGGEYDKEKYELRPISEWK